jgi:3-oxoacyl-[acyl-carrier protein] reductase
MQERGWGRVVNVGSSSTREPIAGLNLSNAHRMAAVGFLKTLSREVAADGITVNSVQPGLHAKARVTSVYGDDPPLQGIPAGRLGSPEDFGAVVAFLCSEQAGYLTGTAIPVDGGAYQALL